MLPEKYECCRENSQYSFGILFETGQRSYIEFIIWMYLVFTSNGKFKRWFEKGQRGCVPAAKEWAKTLLGDMIVVHSTLFPNRKPSLHVAVIRHYLLAWPWEGDQMHQHYSGHEPKSLARVAVSALTSLILSSQSSLREKRPLQIEETDFELATSTIPGKSGNQSGLEL